MKRCRVCGTSKALAEFGRHAGRHDGLNARCKNCDREISRARYQAHRAKINTRIEAYRHAQPQKRRAHRAVRNAVIDGRLSRPGTCEECGVECVPDGHHGDYSRPLEVRWLCRSCHVALHRGLVAA